MNDVTADTSGIETTGSQITALGEKIRSDFDGLKGGLECETPGLNTPGVMDGIANAWQEVCHAVASEVTRAGDGTTAAGQDHANNEDAQTEGMNAAGGK